jgi:nitrate/nitrite transporter NarK
MPIGFLKQNSDRTLALALAVLLCISRVGSVATSIVTPRLTQAYGVLTATWISTVVAVVVTLSCAAYLLIMDTAASKRAKIVPSYKESIHHFPRVFWLLAIICVATYGCLGPFNNSAQRFLSSRFYDGDERAAGLAVR